MNKKAAWAIGILVIVIVGAAFYVFAGKGNRDGTGNTSTSSTNSDNSQIMSMPSESTKGRYENYSAEAFENEKMTQRLLFFHASWCPQCRELDASILATPLPAGVVIFKVDYDSRQDLRKKYGVTLQTTVVKVDKDGNKLQSFVAYDEPTFSSVERELLP
jgi:thiol-disulfide isomerase/thioredoxin